jgi:hypothetical protein
VSFSSRRTFHFAWILTFSIALALVANVSSFADPSVPEEPHFSTMVAYKNATQYHDAADRLRTDLAGTIPKKFVVDGVEYTGNYFRSGENTDVYRVVDVEGRVSALRLPSTSGSVPSAFTFAKAMKAANEHGFPSVKVYAAPTRSSLATRVEFLEGFETLSEVIEHAVRTPGDVRVQWQIGALKDFVQKYGRVRVGDMHGENIGVVMEEGHYVVKMVDIVTDPHNFTVAEHYHATPISSIFSQEKGRLSRKFGPEMRAQVTALEDQVVRETFPLKYDDIKQAKLVAAPPKVEVEPLTETETGHRTVAACTAEESASALETGVKNTVGIAGNTLNTLTFVASAIFPSMNPFANKSVGVSCRWARAHLGRVSCLWDAPINPWNNIAYCDSVKTIKPTGKRALSTGSFREEEICEITFDEFGFRADESKTRDRLEAMGLFDANGRAAQGLTPRALYERIRKELKVTEPFYNPDQSVPEKAPSSMLEG